MAAGPRHERRSARARRSSVPARAGPVVSLLLLSATERVFGSSGHHPPPQSPPSPSPPRCGLLCVGLAGNNGITLLAGQLANLQQITWESSRDGPKQANLFGCITQVGVLPRAFCFADFVKSVVIGGWDVRPTPLGDALYKARIFDYDLVRQLRDKMNAIPVMPGVWDAGFYGEKQAAEATHIVPTATSRAAQLRWLREDIRRFKAEHELLGESSHVTVIWSASVERPSQEYPSAAALLRAIEEDDREVSPSLLYATAALLEGCSFVNGGSQNTLQPGLLELALPECRAAHGAGGGSGPVYVLGTDFKAGQTKAKTAIVEYLRTLGLRPRTIASYNHLGNNDMKNLISPRTWASKARLKTDIFAPWAADGPIDHKVAVLYTEQMGDEKRDLVEYTSESFMGCEHTMLTYTRAMDSALCAPLMVDAAVFCAYLAARGASAALAGAALAYLFKVPEGAAAGTDPGFFHQSRTLMEVLTELTAAEAGEVASIGLLGREAANGIAGTDETHHPPVARGSVICAGLSCIDMQLLSATEPGSREAIARFSGCSVAAGGSTSNTASALRTLGVEAAILTATGRDVHGAELRRLYGASGIDQRLMLELEDVSTSLAVLPVFESGGRACWVDLSANDCLNPRTMLAALSAKRAAPTVCAARALHIGYPHLLKGLQGEALRTFIIEGSNVLQAASGVAPLVSIDINGATLGTAGDADGVLAPALGHVDLLHGNLDEICHLVGSTSLSEATATDDELRRLVAPLLSSGVAIVAVTLGAAGAFVAASDVAERFGRKESLARAGTRWRGTEVRVAALPLSGELNANGAGDAFTAGLLAALLWNEDELALEQVAMLGAAAARQHVDSARRGHPQSVRALLEELKIIPRNEHLLS